MEPTYDGLLGRPLRHAHKGGDIVAVTTTPTIAGSLALDLSKNDVVTASTYAANAEQAAFTLSVSKDVVNKSALIMIGKMASGAAVTLPAGAEIVSGAWSTLYRNVAEVYCYAAGKYMVSITQKTAA